MQLDQRLDRVFNMGWQERRLCHVVTPMKHREAVSSRRSLSIERPIQELDT